MKTNNPTPYTDQELSVLVEEYITQQRSEFSLKGLYSYVVYWGMEDGRITGDQLQQDDKVRIHNIIDRIIREGRIRVVDDDSFIKQ